MSNADGVNINYWDQRLVRWLGNPNSDAALDDLSDILTTSVMAKIRLLLNRMSDDAFTANVQGSARTQLDTMIAQLATYFVAAGGAMALQVNNQDARTNIEQALTDYFAVIGCDGTNEFNPTIGGTPRITLKAALEALNVIAESTETKIGTNTDAVGTTTLFARARQIVDTYLADGSIGLNALKLLIDSVQTTSNDIITKIGTNIDVAGTETLFARLRQIVDTYLADGTIGLANLKALLDDLQTEVDKIGDPTDTDLSTDIVNVQTEVDKIGDPNTLWGGATKTALSYANAAYKHIHNPMFVLDNDMDGFQVTTHNDPKTFGAFVELWNSTDRDIDFHWANIEDIEANGRYTIEIHIVDEANLQLSVTKLCEISIRRLAPQTRSFSKYTQCPVIPTGSRLAARVKNNQTGEHVVDLTLEYHDYE